MHHCSRSLPPMGTSQQEAPLGEHREGPFLATRETWLAYNARVFVRNDSSTDWLVIPQASHAFLAWQVALHWGNRATERPSPRAECLAAVLLHDSGWDRYDAAPEPDEKGRPRAFDRMPPERHLEIWRRCIACASAHAGYAGLLVAHHFLRLASWKICDLEEEGNREALTATTAFVDETNAIAEEYQHQLEADPRFAPATAGSGLERNLAILGACDGIAVYLCAGMAGPFSLTVHGAGGAPVDIYLDRVGDTTVRLRPWPLQGRRLTVHCEARRIPAARYGTSHDLAEAVAGAPRMRLAFTLLPPGAPA